MRPRWRPLRPAPLPERLLMLAPRLGIALCLAALLLLAPAGHSDDWPQWRGPDRTNLSREKGLLKEWPKDGPKLLWKAEGLGNGVPSIAVASGRVFVLGY